MVQNFYRPKFLPSENITRTIMYRTFKRHLLRYQAVVKLLPNLRIHFLSGQENPSISFSELHAVHITNRPMSSLVLDSPKYKKPLELGEKN